MDDTNPDRAYRYFLVKAGPVLPHCKDWLHRVRQVRATYGVFVRARAASGWYGGSPGRGGKPWALVPPKRKPEGWRERIVRGRPVLVPDKRTAKGRAEQQALQDLPNMPASHEHNEVLGWKQDYKLRKRDGVEYGAIGDVHLLHTGKIFCFAVPLNRDVGGFELPRAIQRRIARWQPPSGLKEISEAQWDLIVARNRVAVERVARRKAA